MFAKDRGKSLTTAGGAHGYVEVVLRGGGFAKGLVPASICVGQTYGTGRTNSEVEHKRKQALTAGPGCR